MRLLVKDLQQLPSQAGVYRFFDNTDQLLYVGKAKNLAKRVGSYFKKNYEHSPRIALMVSKIFYIELTITLDEASALILENNLIKSLKPRYNIIFRDDKTYPMIRISRHEFPKIESFRGKIDRENIFFGPYPNAYAVLQSIELLQKIFKLRTCGDTVFNNRSRPCMLYQIKRCSAPCVGYITASEYQKQIDYAYDFLNGNYHIILDNLVKSMYSHADLMEFEKAAQLRDAIMQIREISKTQIINSLNKPITGDLVIYQESDAKIFIYMIILRSGVYVGDKHFILENKDNDCDGVIKIFLEGYYLEQANINHLFINYDFTPEYKKLIKKAFNLEITRVLKGQMERLIQMGERNLEKIIANHVGDKVFKEGAVILANYLHLELVERIECIDVSHNQGDSTVAGIVVYANGVIDHKQYRRYNLDASFQGDDLKAIATVLCLRLQNSKLPMPQVFLIDGGIKHYEIAKNIIIDRGLCGKIGVVAIYKGEHRNPIYDRVIITANQILSYNSELKLFKLLQSLRDEAHRFAITGHRRKQIKRMTVSQLIDIPKVGAKKKSSLITHFGSVEGVKNATLKELQEVEGIGYKLANEIYSYFH